MENPIPPSKEDLKTKDLLFKALGVAVSDTPPAPDLPPPEASDYQPETLAEMVRGGKLKKEEPVVPPPVVPDAVVPPPVVPPAAEVPVIPPPEEPKVELRKITVPDVEPVAIRRSQEKPTGVDLGDISDLTEDELAEVELAQFAERSNPGRYTGRARQVLTYIREHRKLVVELSKEDEDVRESSKYQRFTKSRPDFTPVERSKLTRQQIKEEAKREIEAEFEEKYLKKIDSDIREQKVRPAIQKSVSDFTSQLNEVIAKDQEIDGVFEEVAANVRHHATTAAEEFLAISTELKPFNPNNPNHEWLAKFIDDQANLLIQSKSPHLKRGNQNFVTRAKFNGLPAAERAKHFTFTDEDILQMLAVNAKYVVDAETKAQRERLAKLGYEKKPATAKPPVVPKTPTEEEVVVPKAGQSQSSVHTSVPNNKKKDPMLSFILDSATNK